MQKPELANLSATRDLVDGTIQKIAVIVRPVDGEFLRRLQRLGKHVHGYSAAQVAEKFPSQTRGGGVHRATFKAWQSGKKKISVDHAERALKLFAIWSADAKENQTAVHEKTRDVIRLNFAAGCDARMRTLEITHKPIKCDGCGKWFVPVSSRQKRHNLAACRTRAAQKKRGKNGK